jgi:muconolactone delta-isomerase
MPLASADPFGGVIITDWYTPPGTSGERFKATIYILSRDLRSDGIKVNIFRQVLQNGQWADATVADSTVGDIENKVLARARRMREQLQASG